MFGSREIKEFAQDKINTLYKRASVYADLQCMAVRHGNKRDELLYRGKTDECFAKIIRIREEYGLA